MHFWYLLTTNFIWKILISFPNGVDNATCMQRTLFHEATIMSPSFHVLTAIDENKILMLVKSLRNRPFSILCILNVLIVRTRKSLFLIGKF